MREKYIRQVEKRLSLPRGKKREVLEDLREIFSSAAEHGETEAQVVERLGSPEEYAAGVAQSLGKRRSWPSLVGLVLCCAACIGCLGAFFAAGLSRPPAGAIGFAQGSTGIQLTGGADLSPLLLALAGAALVLALFFLVKLVRGKRRERL